MIENPKVRNLVDVVWNKLGVDRRLTIENRTKVLFFVFTCAVIIWLIGSIAGYVLSQYLTELNKKSDFYGTIGLLDKDSGGYYLPLDIANTGDYDLENATVSLHTCYSETPSSFFINNIPHSQQTQIKIRENDILKPVSSKQCDINSIANSIWCTIPTYQNRTNILVPITTCTVSFCGSCPYEISMSSIRLNKTLNYSLLAPFPQQFKAYTKPISNSTENLTFVDNVSVNIISNLEKCFLDKICTYVNSGGAYKPQLRGALDMWIESRRFGGANVTIEPINSS